MTTGEKLIEYFNSWRPKVVLIALWAWVIRNVKHPEARRFVTAISLALFFGLLIFAFMVSFNKFEGGSMWDALRCAFGLDRYCT